MVSYKGMHVYILITVDTCSNDYSPLKYCALCKNATFGNDQSTWRTSDLSEKFMYLNVVNHSIVMSIFDSNLVLIAFLTEL